MTVKLNPFPVLKNSSGTPMNWKSPTELRAAFPSLYFSESVSNLKKEAEDAGTVVDASLKGVNSVLTGVRDAATAKVVGDLTLKDVLNDPKKALEEALSLVNPNITEARQLDANEANLLQQNLNQARKSFIADSKSEKAKLTYLNALQSTYSSKFVKSGLSKFINEIFLDFKKYQTQLNELKVTRSQLVIIKAIASLNDGTAKGYEYPFSALSATDHKGLSVWFTVHDKELVNWYKAIENGIKGVTNPHPIMTSNRNAIMAFMIAFGNVESNLTLSARNLSQGGYVKDGFNETSRKGAFTAFQMRWSYMMKMVNAMGMKYVPRMQNIDTDPNLQAAIFADYINQAITQIASKWLTISTDGFINWKSHTAENNWKDYIEDVGSFGASALGVTLTMLSASLAVGPTLPDIIDTKQTAVSYSIRKKQLQPFINNGNLYAKGANYLLFKSVFDSGLPLGGFAKALQFKEPA